MPTPGAATGGVSWSLRKRKFGCGIGFDGYELRYTAGGTSRTVAVPQRSTTSTSLSVSSGVTYVFTLVATSPSSWTSITNPTLPAITCP